MDQAWFAFRDSHGHLKTQQNAPNPKRPNEWKSTLKASEDSGEYLWKEKNAGLDENMNLQESLELRARDTEGWRQRARERRGFEENAWKREVSIRTATDETQSQLKSLKTALKITGSSAASREDRVDDGDFELEKKSKAENGRHPGSQLEVDMKRLMICSCNWVL